MMPPTAPGPTVSSANRLPRTPTATRSGGTPDRSPAPSTMTANVEPMRTEARSDCDAVTSPRRSVRVMGPRTAATQVVATIKAKGSA